jgi:LmbE family N-acetylglucosaminyl deacetylase
MPDALRLLAILPHPDDESLGMGGTLAHYATEGVETYLVCATRGERGWSGPPQDHPGLEALGRIREAELRCAAEVLDLDEVSFLDLIDGEVDRAKPDEVLPPMVAHVRRIRPQVVVTFGPDGTYGHPDHIALSQFAGAAVVAAADPTYTAPGAHGPHRTPKLYHIVDSQAMVERVRQLTGGIEMMVDGVVRRHVGWEDWAITTRIDTRPHFDTAWQAILCHRSQMPGFGPLADLPREDLLPIWGEGTFVRAFSLVNAGRLVETDLFTGLR